MKPFRARRSWRKFESIAVALHHVTLETNQSVLAHQNNSLTTHGDTGLVHLLGADIVDADDENGLEFLEKAPELLEVSGLVLRLAPHFSLLR